MFYFLFFLTVTASFAIICIEQATSRIRTHRAHRQVEAQVQGKVVDSSTVQLASWGRRKGQNHPKLVHLGPMRKTQTALFESQGIAVFGLTKQENTS